MLAILPVTAQRPGHCVLNSDPLLKGAWPLCCHDSTSRCTEGLSIAAGNGCGINPGALAGRSCDWLKGGHRLLAAKLPGTQSCREDTGGGSLP